MAKKHKTNLSYLNLAILALVLSVGLELISGQVNLFDDMVSTLSLIIATIYVLAAVFLTAFVAQVKIANEQRYILYLVILAVTFFRVMTLMKELL